MKRNQRKKMAVRRTVGPLVYDGDGRFVGVNYSGHGEPDPEYTEDQPLVIRRMREENGHRIRED